MTTALTKPFDIGIKKGDECRMKMAAVKIYQGGAVGVVLATGYATPMVVATAGMRFVGVAEETIDNSAGSAGDKWIRIKRTGLCGFDNTGLTVANVGQWVFFTDYDHQVQATATAVPAGILVAIDEASVAWVDITVAVVSQVYVNTTDNKVYECGTTLKSSALT